jgi:hypothetical protein
LTDWNKKKPGRVESIFTSIQNIVPSHLLDTSEFDFEKLGALNDQHTPDIDAWLSGGRD